MPRPWTMVLAVAALAVGTASVVVIVERQSVPDAGKIIGYVPAPPSRSPSPSATQPPLTLPNPSGRALMVSIVGDSLVIGKYATGPDKRNRNLILAALRKEHSVTPLEASPSEVTGLATKVSVPSHLDLVILELGTDDSRRLSPATFASDFDALVASVRRTSASAALVCTGLWSATGGAYDAVIERACRGAGGRFVSLRAMYDVPANRGPAKISGYYGVSDATHPNDAGHRAIAKAVLAALGVALR